MFKKIQNIHVKYLLKVYDLGGEVLDEAEHREQPEVVGGQVSADRPVQQRGLRVPLEICSFV